MAFDLLKMPYDLLILVFSASQISFCFLKPQFTYSFWCFPQAKSAFAFSNPSLLIHFGVFRKPNQLLLSQTPVYLLILVFSASQISFCFLKPQFTYSFWRGKQNDVLYQYCVGFEDL
ncbi:hypothetical protein [Nostoc favosum]|uniref:Uncharacterized protein n=1 Tax=Nostoc favosum CHAB5714 TaxID=2780399 RepID=A0ABS8IED7_9NOSO|nr:hypothetical protein [Nostoc favosum]MCC5602600.1 hypothetical protein [Nostoc favosum CHAB5714]